MRHYLGVRIAALVLVAAMAAPAFAAGPRDDSPFDRFGRAIKGFVHQVVKIIHPTDVPLLGDPKP